MSAARCLALSANRRHRAARRASRSSIARVARRCTGRARRAGRAERRRQDHADARARRAAAGRGRHRARRPRARGNSRRASARAASPICRRATRSIGRCRSPRSSRSAAIRTPIRSRRPQRRRPRRGRARARGDRHRGASPSASVTTLSGGERARVALARALATRGADPARRRADRVARSAPSARGDGAAAPRRARGGAVLAIVHDLTLAARFADRVVVMDRGRLVADGGRARC